MIKISQALDEVLQEYSFLHFALAHKIANLTQTAQFIRPLLEARLQKDIQVSAIVMALSRYQKHHPNEFLKERYRIDNMSVQSGLASLTFHKTDRNQKKINELYQHILADGGYIVLAVSTTEIAINTNRKYSDRILEALQEEPVFMHREVSSLAIKFDKHYLDFPGLSYYLFQKLTLQNINLIEYASTATEIVFFLRNEDVKLAFETFQYCFERE